MLTPYPRPQPAKRPARLYIGRPKQLTEVASLALQIVPVIMSGGSGTRLWPLSTDAMPKQFHALGSLGGGVGARTMIQETVLRFSDQPDVFAAPVLICGARHGEIIARQLAQVGIPPSCVVLEPFGRNTAVVAAIAAEVVQRLHPGALALLLPADHVVTDAEGFCATVMRAAEIANARIVTFGIAPTSPETGYGYIQAGQPLAEGVFSVARFVEKPSLAVAQAYLADGGYCWNGGIFLFSPEVMLAEIGSLRPDIAAAAAATLKASPDQGGRILLDEETFAVCPSVSIDVALMEQTQLAAVAPCDVGWADVGSWSELWRLGPTDAHGNLVRGQAILHEVKGTLVWSDGAAITAIGVEDIVVVATGEAVLVMPRARAQDVKLIVERFKAGDFS